MTRRFYVIALTIALSCLFAFDATAKPPIRADFMDVYPALEFSQLDDLPSSTRHCGVCHLDFDGGGARNPYGLQVEVGRNNGLTTTQAVLAIEGDDTDGDGFDNVTEILSTLFSNTPTFPGWSEANKNDAVNIPISEIEPYLTPSGGSDTTPPVVSLIWPVGGENLQAGAVSTVQFTATDANGISHINVYMSEDGGTVYEPVALSQPSTGNFDWFVPNLPGNLTRIKVEAVDNANNPGEAESGSDFTVLPQLGRAPTTLRDMKMPGTQPHEGVILDDPTNSCVTCHGGYDAVNEPWTNWRGSLMGQAMRDPLFLACLAVAEQDAPSVGDLCIKCHSPGGWMEGRSVDTSGGLINGKDYEGVQCDFCHRMVDFNYVPGVSPPQDVDVLNTVDPMPTSYSNSSFINDPQPLRRGPYADAQAAHSFAESPFHREANLCGTCHDVSNPVYVKNGDVYELNAFDTEHPDMELRNMFPIERTFSEWTQSEYATTGVFQPQFAGNKADGIVSTCQDCHMRDVNARGADGGPLRADMPLHDFTGGNTFIGDILADFYPGEVDVAQLQAAEDRARSMLQLAASLEVTPEVFGVTVRVTNETGHKLPSGYPEGRRIWLNVVGKDIADQVIWESGHYDATTGELHHDAQAKIYHVEPGLSEGVAAALSLPSGPSFHFVLNDMIYLDNRIPPRGFTNANFEAIQSPPVNYTYADGQYWDDTAYVLHADVKTVEVKLYYQTTSKEYIEFLRDENTTNTMGQQLYDAWVAQGMNPPELMAEATVDVNITGTAVEGEDRPTILSLGTSRPNPFGGKTMLAYALPKQGRVEIAVFDLRGRKVRTLVSEIKNPGRYATSWDGRDGRGKSLASGVYMVRLEAGGGVRMVRVTLMR